MLENRLLEIDTTLPDKQIMDELSEIAKDYMELSFNQLQNLESFLISFGMTKFDDMETLILFLKMEIIEYLYDKPMIAGIVTIISGMLNVDDYLVGDNPFKYHKSGIIIDSRNMLSDIEEAYSKYIQANTN